MPTFFNERYEINVIVNLNDYYSLSWVPLLIWMIDYIEEAVL